MPTKDTAMSWVVRSAEFCQTDLYKNYVEEMRLEREEILMRGKKSRDPHILSMLEGFDQAASFFQRCKDTVRIANTPVEEEEDND